MPLEEPISNPELLAQAQKKFDAGKQALGSKLVPEDAAKEIAFEHALEAFSLYQHSHDFFALLWFCVEHTKRSLSSLGIDDKIESALSVDRIRQLISLKIHRRIGQLMASHIKDRSQARENISDFIMLMGKIFRAEPSAEYACVLALCYTYIGRMSDALAMSRAAAEKDVAYARTYIDLCSNQHKYRELVSYYEQYKPTCNNHLKGSIAQAYERIMRGVTWHERERASEHGPTKEQLIAAKKACYLRFEIISLYKETNFADPEEIERLIECGAHLFLVAGVIEGASAEDLEEVGIGDTPSDLRTKGCILLQYIIKRLSHESQDNEEIRNLATSAKINLLATMSLMDRTIQELKELVSFAMQLLDQVEKNPVFSDHSINNSLSILFGRLYVETDENEFLEMRKVFAEATMRQHWDDEISHTMLINTYSVADECFSEHNAIAYKTLAYALDILIKCDLLNITDGPGGKWGFVTDLPRTDPREAFDNDHEKLAEAAMQSSLSLNTYFAPLYEALKSVGETYNTFLENKILPGLRILHRIKKPYSILLKLLKLDTPKFSDVTDLIAFRVLTKTETEAEELYAKVREDMESDARLIERKTLHTPSKAGYRSLDITGFSKTAGCVVQVQIRPENVEQTIERTAAHHDFYKIVSGGKLKDAVDENPLHYLHLMEEIAFKVASFFREAQKREGPLSTIEALEIYGFNEP